VQGEILVCSTQYADEMRLEGLDGFLGDVPSVIVWRNQLKSHVVLPNLLFEFLRTLVVQNVHFWCDTCVA
jgi:hypothetical protein